MLKLKISIIIEYHRSYGRSQWSRGLSRRSTTSRLMRLWVRIPPGAWMSLCCECCVLSGRGLCDGLITCTEESCRLWCVVVCDLEMSWIRRPGPLGAVAQKMSWIKRPGPLGAVAQKMSWIRRPWPTGGCCTKNKQTNKNLENKIPLF